MIKNTLENFKDILGEFLEFLYYFMYINSNEIRINRIV